MNLTNYCLREDFTCWTRSVREIVFQRSDSMAVSMIEQALSQYREARFSIAVLGKAKRGKSTLLNALLGRRDDLVAPVDKLPASSAISRFSWCEQERVVIHFRDGRREETGYGRVRDFVTEELNPQNVKGVEIVDILGPFTGLDQEVEFVDTPGAGSIHEHHDALLHAFIPRADAVIFLVSARMPIDQDELALLSHVKKSDVNKLFFAINRVDEIQGNDLQDAIRHNQTLLSQVGFTCPTIHPISAKRAFEGNLPASGLLPLVTEISAFIAAHKGYVLNERLVSRVCQAASPVQLGLEMEINSSTKTHQELDDDLRKLSESKQTLVADRTLSEREFELSWNRAVDDMERGLDEVKTQVTNHFVSQIQAAGLTEISKLRQQLPTLISQQLEEYLNPLTRQMETELREATSKLQTKYPRLTWDTSTLLPVHNAGNTSFVFGSLGGAAAAATGVGLATAGSVAAASIAAANTAAIATAATTTVVAPSVLSSLLTSVPYVGGLLSSLATGTATVSAPAAMTTAPLWVALSGPVGWSLAGIGVLAIPFAWRSSKLKAKDQIELAVREQVKQIIDRIRKDRLPDLRNMADKIIEEFRIRLDRQLNQMEVSLQKARVQRPDRKMIDILHRMAESLNELLTNPPQPVNATGEKQTLQQGVL